MPDSARTCGRCTLCCKIFENRELGSPEGQWCPHCSVGQGCMIYAQRPDECSAFQCRWLCDPSLSDDWYPAKCHMVLRAIMVQQPGRQNPQRAAGPSQSLMIVACVDPDRPEAWRREPYYSGFRTLARQLYPAGGSLFVKIGLRKIAILPDEDVDLGICTEKDRISIKRTGSRWYATKAAAS